MTSPHPSAGTPARRAERHTAVLVVIFTVQEGRLHVLLVRRSAEPFKGSWSLPGGLLVAGESLDTAAARKLDDETGLTDVYLEQLYTFCDLDGRGSIAAAYFALVDASRAQLARRRAWLPAWHGIDDLPKLAFDNRLVIDCARQRLQAKLEYSNVAYSLLPPEFTLSQLQRVYEAILSRPLDKRNFRKRVLSLELVTPTGGTATEGRHRPARLYRFRQRKPVIL